MKKNVIYVLLLFLVSAAAAQKPQYNIGILSDLKTEKADSLLERLQHQIQAVVGEDADIIFPERNHLINNFDLHKAEENYKRLLTNETDLILAFGAVNHRVITNQQVHRKPTILFGAINTDDNHLNSPEVKSGKENLYDMVEKYSFKNDLRKLKELTGFKKVGIALEKGLINSLTPGPIFDDLLKSLDAEYKFIPFESLTDITFNLDDIDAIYFVGGFFFSDEEVKVVAKELINKKIPSFTINGISHVKLGLMATHQPTDNIDLVLRRLALTVEKYVNGTPLSEMPVLLDYEERLTLNYNTTEAVGVPIKLSLVNETDFVGEFSEIPVEQKYGLMDVIEGVLDENLRLKASEKDVALANQEARLAASEYLPNVVATADATHVDPDVAEVAFGQNPEFQSSGNIRLEQIIFSEGLNANISIQKSLQKAEQENFNAEQLNAVFEVANAYFNTLIAKTNLRLQFRNLEATKKNYQIARQNFEAGLTGKSDVLRFKSEMAQNTQTMVEASNQLDQGFIRLNQLLNNPTNKKIDIAAVELDGELFKTYNHEEYAEFIDNPATREVFKEFLIQEAKKNAPELRALNYNINATDRAVKLNDKGRLLPTIALQAQYGTIFDRSGKGSTGDGFMLPDNNYSVGINMSIPIFNRNQNNLRKQQALIQKDRLNTLEKDANLAIESNVRTAVLDLINRISNIQLSTVSEEAAEEALELTQASYSNGAATSIQLIDAQNNLLNARLQKANALHTYLISALQIERFIGYFFLLHTEEDNDRFEQRFLEFYNNN